MTQKQRMCIPFSLLANGEDCFDFPVSLADAHSNISIWEDESTVNAEFAVPGFKPEEIEVHYDKAIVTVRANRADNEQEKARKYFRKMAQSFLYQFTLPVEIEPHSETAEIQNGVLKITFNKIKKEEPRKIPIKAA